MRYQNQTRGKGHISLDLDLILLCSHQPPADAPMVGEPRVKVNGDWQPRSRAAGQLAPDGTQNLVVSHLPPRDSVVEIYVDTYLEWSGSHK